MITSNKVIIAFFVPGSDDIRGENGHKSENQAKIALFDPVSEKLLVALFGGITVVSFNPSAPFLKCLGQFSCHFQQNPEKSKNYPAQKGKGKIFRERKKKLTKREKISFVLITAVFEFCIARK